MPLPFIPWRAPVIQDLKARLLGSEAWGQWIIALQRAVDSTPQRFGMLVEPGTLAAALPAQTLATVPATGLYRVNYYALITQAASVSSSLTFTIRWTDGGVAYLFTNAALVNGLAGATQTVLRPLHVDQGAAVTIEAAYASVGGTPMQYQLHAWVEAIS